MQKFMTMFTEKIKVKGRAMKLTPDGLRAVRDAQSLGRATVSVQQPMDKKEEKFVDVILNTSEVE